MELLEGIRARRSVRRYVEDEEIPQTNIELMLEAAMLAPSACNTRPWEFFVITEKKTRYDLADLHPNAKMLKQAPLGIVVCGRPQAQQGTCSEFWPQDCGAAIENLLLEAVNLGYGACWCGIYPSKDRTQAIAELLHTDSVPVAVVSVGVPAEQPKCRGFFDSSLVHYIY